MERFTEWKSRRESRETWKEGTVFLFRGEEVTLSPKVHANGREIHFADQVIPVTEEADLRTSVLAHLRKLAEKELPIRTRELAAQHDITIQRVTVRAQKTRWGSCSARGTISLNWRLIQAPLLVRDYLVIHELMHRRQMNHSTRYWKLVEAAFPDFRVAEQWLKTRRLDSLG